VPPRERLKVVLASGASLNVERRGERLAICVNNRPVLLLLHPDASWLVGALGAMLWSEHMVETSREVATP
jgi:hypothetical protein